LEDSFGFSWGFPESDSVFPLTGYFKFMKGAAAYRFFLQDAIRFEKSLRVTIGFGIKEDPVFQRDFSKPGSTLQFSSTAYWYQSEPHSAFPKIPGAAERTPAPEERFWPDREKLASPAELQSRGVKLQMLWGHPDKEIAYAAPGYSAAASAGYAWSGWAPPVYYARASNDAVELTLSVPKSASGLLRLYIIDPDSFEGGRKQKVSVAGRSLGTFEHFEEGKWLEQKLEAQETADGRVVVRAENERKGSNAVISILEWVER